MWRPSVSKTAEMYHDASSGFSRTTNFSTALAEVYEAPYKKWQLLKVK
ncbi:hypothetical protein GBAR_LOCUS21631 [Geodia barretti]|uniref:Uncharacterized protein n=1 Tax=Geodia barretti TaxID=519541 RepID=A0AA35SZN1_GEOBA|nr:hypothetical protein GBAR_LOCUS21631 [Geodia barretti]